MTSLHLKNIENIKKDRIWENIKHEFSEKVQNKGRPDQHCLNGKEFIKAREKFFETLVYMEIFEHYNK